VPRLNPWKGFHMLPFAVLPALASAALVVGFVVGTATRADRFLDLFAPAVIALLLLLVFLDWTAKRIGWRGFLKGLGK
jgi:hypothetical protein